MLGEAIEWLNDLPFSTEYSNTSAIESIQDAASDSQVLMDLYFQSDNVR